MSLDDEVNKDWKKTLLFPMVVLSTIIITFGVNAGLSCYRNNKYLKKVLDNHSRDIKTIEYTLKKAPDNLEGFKNSLKVLLDLEEKGYYIRVSPSPSISFTTLPRPDYVVWLPVEKPFSKDVIKNKDSIPAAWLYVYAPDKDDLVLNPSRVDEIIEKWGYYEFDVPVSYVVIPEGSSLEETRAYLMKAVEDVLQHYDLTLEDLKIPGK